MSENLDEIRNLTLKQIEQSERNLKWAIGGAAAVEAIFLIAFLVIADWGSPTHWLILIAAVGTYCIVGMGLFGLGAHVDRCTLRVLKAFEVSGR